MNPINHIALKTMLHISAQWSTKIIPARMRISDLDRLAGRQNKRRRLQKAVIQGGPRLLTRKGNGIDSGNDL